MIKYLFTQFLSSPKLEILTINQCAGLKAFSELQNIVELPANLKFIVSTFLI